MAFKAIVTAEIEFCSMCPFGGMIEHYNPGIPGYVNDIHCSKLHRRVHLNLEKLECCATGSSLTAEDRVPSDCPFIQIHRVNAGEGYTQRRG